MSFLVLVTSFKTPSTSGDEQFPCLWTRLCLHHLPVGLFGKLLGVEEGCSGGKYSSKDSFCANLTAKHSRADALVSGVLTKVSPALMAKEKVPQQLPRGHLEGAEQSGRN